ncbi:hypothetical protein JW916_16255 [Candidatus Sumerlaeota bacterium]|nr:hypothetical protein [Candidatus Sumerlaeota bacterium]
MSRRENLLRAVRFESPDYIPMRFRIHPTCWMFYPPDALHELMCSHPFLFPGAHDFEPPSAPLLHPWEKAGRPWTDSWGCVWRTNKDGVAGTVIEHPLESWSAFEGFHAPDPDTDSGMGPIHWGRIAEDLAAAGKDRPAKASLPPGHTFQRLAYLRGHDNILADMAEDALQLPILIRIVEQFNLVLVRRFLDLGAEWIEYPEDLGSNSGPALSPGQFREFIRPVYEREIAPTREKGAIAQIVTAGDIRLLAEDLLAVQPNVIRLQDLVNGVEWIRQHLGGRVCIDLDIDREQITPFAAPTRIDALIREEVGALSRREGGLLMSYTLYPGVRPQNIQAVMDAMERYSLYRY